MGDETDRPIPQATEAVAQQFLNWRSPRFGAANPEPMNNPVWEWIIKSRLSAYQTNEKLGGPSSMDAGPCWCFSRFGQSQTTLLDRRVVYIAGEHEDSYDMDFYIYNDVVVEHPDGRIEIFGYPREIFQPTDFHSATLINDRIIIIGNLGYPEDRRSGCTPVYELNLATFKMARIETTGSPPGWIHRHQAEWKNDSIVITRGMLAAGGKTGLIENIDDWEYNFTDRSWSRLTRRQWEQWTLRRSDGQTNRLWQIRSAHFNRRFNIPDVLGQSLESMPAIVRDAIREHLNVEAADLSDLYQPAIPHELLPDCGEFGVSRIKVDGVIVRYVEGIYDVRIIFEGELSQETVSRLINDIREKLSTAEKVPYEAVRLSHPPG